jgi:hypothetical protein
MKTIIPSLSVLTAAKRFLANENAMNLKRAFVALPAALCILGSGVANAAEPIKDTGAMACVNDKWDVKEPEKTRAGRRCYALRPDPGRSRGTNDHPGLRGQLRIHA